LAYGRKYAHQGQNNPAIVIWGCLPLSVNEVVERRAELIIQSPGEPDRTYRLTHGSTYVGTGADDGIKLDDEILVPKHLELDWDGAELWVIYLGNGVRPLVNGQLAAEAQLKSGDQLEIGEHQLRIRILRRTVRGSADQAAPAADVPDEAAASPVPAGDAAQGRQAAEVAPAAPAWVSSVDEPALLEFSVHLLREQPRKGAIVGAGLVAFFLLMWFVIIPGNTMLMMISMFILLGSVGAFLFPLHYRLTDSRVEIRGFPLRDRKAWTRFVRYVEFPDAVQLLVPQRDFRGRVIKGSLIYYGNHRDEIMEIVRSKVAKGGPPVKPERRRGRGKASTQEGGDTSPSGQ